MRTTILAICAIGLCLDSSKSSAREAELLRFPDAPIGLEPQMPGVPPLAIVQQMENVVRTPVESNRSVAPLFASGNACEDYSYTPTYWLSTKTERRRAIYLPFVVAIACEFGLPARLLDVVVAQESGYNPRAISSAGAMGMMQIMPGTARSLGLVYPWDPIANIRAGARYLRDQKDRFGRMDLALAAYNAGPERKSLNAGYIPAIPETLGYVRTITTNWARLAADTPVDMSAEARASAATLAMRTAGYREVDLSIYSGMNAANPI
ncbi:lytic transglycosylase domain-containing protein [Novosphingobium sp. CCH12-A3]|uniref:lytic transglycosylase domain-containing protein n=1 Tax=Novosphingobium sp. CCH12-A3 TaxID=1768752 RepID=UPI000785FAC3|nr:lytic transglycosylase domain-containing protein [Novosphingobium sp. CCH12-A3]